MTVVPVNSPKLTVNLGPAVDSKRIDRGISVPEIRCEAPPSSTGVGIALQSTSRRFRDISFTTQFQCTFGFKGEMKLSDLGTFWGWCVQ